MIPMIDSVFPGMMVMHLVVDPAAIGVVAGLLGTVAWVVAGVARELRDKAPAVRVGRLAPVAA